jgi:hypothetical protein
VYSDAEGDLPSLALLDTSESNAFDISPMALRYVAQFALLLIAIAEISEVHHRTSPIKLDPFAVRLALGAERSPG